MTPTSSRQAAGEWLKSQGRSAGPRDRWVAARVRLFSGLFSTSGSRPLPHSGVRFGSGPGISLDTLLLYESVSLSREVEMIAEKTACLGVFIGLSSYKYEL